MIEIKAIAVEVMKCSNMDDHRTVKCDLKQTCYHAGPPLSAWLVEKYDGRVPRYTSYPTAVNFNTDIGASQYRNWLGALAPDRPLSLYLHVPFCERLCWYCACHTRAAHKKKTVADYVRRLVREIDLVADAIPHRPVVSAIHLGGGSPNMLSASDLAQLFSRLRARFVLADQAVVAAELDPRSLTPEWISAAVSLGLNRASLGVQDLDPSVQVAINRVQPHKLIEWSMKTLRSEGVESINVDLVYGLPRQTIPGLARTIDQLVPLEPDRIALFGYAHVPWMMPRQKLIREGELPDAGQRYQQQLVANNKLQKAGYIPIGLDHFALPTDDLAIAAENGFLRRNFQGYTSDNVGTVIGLGASSISTFHQGYAQNSPDIRKWQEKMDEGCFATSRGIVLTREDRLFSDIIQSLMCDLEVDFVPILRHWQMPSSILSPALARLHDMEKDGLVRLCGSTLTVTLLGRPFLRTICTSFDQYTASSCASPRHARAI